VEESGSAEGLSVVEDCGWEATGSEINLGVKTLKRCSAIRLEWGCIQVLLFNMSKMAADCLMCRQGDKKQLRPRLTWKIQIESGFIRLNVQATRWLGG